MSGTKTKQTSVKKTKSSASLASANLSLRASKKQSEVLAWVQQFINQHGYGPSYREVMRGLNYTSVSTVANHINNLVAAGYLAKKGKSARSLYVLKPLKSLNLSSLSGSNSAEPSGAVKSHEKWLVDKISKLLDKAEQNLEEDDFYSAQIAIEAVKILGLDAAALSLSARLKQLESKLAGL
jgi:SOS-response transcriptional repressor LexA